MTAHMRYHTETAAEVAHALDKRPKKSGDSWRVPCPAHDGDDRNLSIADGDAGSLRLVCFSRGCSYKSIVKSLRDKGVLSYTREWKYPNGKTVTRNDHPDAERKYTSPGSPKDTPLLVFDDDGLSPICYHGGRTGRTEHKRRYVRRGSTRRSSCGASYPSGWKSAGLADY